MSDSIIKPPSVTYLYPDNVSVFLLQIIICIDIDCKKNNKKHKQKTKKQTAFLKRKQTGSSLWHFVAGKMSTFVIMSMFYKTTHVK